MGWVRMSERELQRTLVLAEPLCREALFDLITSLRRIPLGILREVDAHRSGCDDTAERVAAETILRHLLHAGWQLHRPASAADLLDGRLRLPWPGHRHAF